VLGLAVVNAGLTPITTHACEWLENRVGLSPRLHTHTELGDTMLYFSIALLVAAILLALLQVRASRSGSVNTVAAVAIAVVVIVASVATTVQVYRIGDSGARRRGATPQPRPHLDAFCCNTVDGGRGVTHRAGRFVVGIV
jgi:hypothetical protein